MSEDRYIMEGKSARDSDPSDTSMQHFHPSVLERVNLVVVMLTCCCSSRPQVDTTDTADNNTKINSEEGASLEEEEILL